MMYSKRRRKVIRQLGKSRAQAMLVSSPVNVQYLTGFKSSNGFILLCPAQTVVLTDPRYETALKALAAAQGFTTAGLKKGLAKEIGTWCRKLGIRRLAYEAGHLTASTFSSLKKKNRSVKWIPAGNWIMNVRMIKEPEELSLMRTAIAVAQKAFMSIAKKDWVGLREWEAVELLEDRMRHYAGRAGFRATPSFEAIVAAGENAAVPHHSPGTTRIRKGMLLKVDWGVKIAGYCSDTTRTLFLGTPDARFRKIYGTVLRAQLAAIRALKPGAQAKQADLAARRAIERAGYGNAFTHGTGHQIGMQVHEGFGLAKAAKERMKPGMIFTVEPGIYLPGWGGVRIEDMVLITPAGHEVMTSVPK